MANHFRRAVLVALVMGLGGCMPAHLPARLARRPKPAWMRGHGAATACPPRPLLDPAETHAELTTVEKERLFQRFFEQKEGYAAGCNCVDPEQVPE